jgi:hypothetical protein
MTRFRNPMSRECVGCGYNYTDHCYCPCHVDDRLFNILEKVMWVVGILVVLSLAYMAGEVAWMLLR